MTRSVLTIEKLASYAQAINNGNVQDVIRIYAELNQ